MSFEFIQINSRISSQTSQSVSVCARSHEQSTQQLPYNCSHAPTLTRVANTCNDSYSDCLIVEPISPEPEPEIDIREPEDEQQVVHTMLGTGSTGGSTSTTNTANSNNSFGHQRERGRESGQEVDCNWTFKALTETYEQFLQGLPQKQKEYHELVMSATKSANYPFRQLSAPLVLAKQQQRLIESQFPATGGATIAAVHQSSPIRPTSHNWPTNHHKTTPAVLTHVTHNHNSSNSNNNNNSYPQTATAVVYKPIGVHALHNNNSNNNNINNNNPIRHSIQHKQSLVGHHVFGSTNDVRLNRNLTITTTSIPTTNSGISSGTSSHGNTNNNMNSSHGNIALINHRQQQQQQQQQKQSISPSNSIPMSLSHQQLQQQQQQLIQERHRMHRSPQPLELMSSQPKPTNGVQYARSYPQHVTRPTPVSANQNCALLSALQSNQSQASYSISSGYGIRPTNTGNVSIVQRHNDNPIVTIHHHNHPSQSQHRQSNIYPQPLPQPLSTNQTTVAQTPQSLHRAFVPEMTSKDEHLIAKSAHPVSALIREQSCSSGRTSDGFDPIKRHFDSHSDYQRICTGSGSSGAGSGSSGQQLINEKQINLFKLSEMERSARLGAKLTLPLPLPLTSHQTHSRSVIMSPISGHQNPNPNQIQNQSHNRSPVPKQNSSPPSLSHNIPEMISFPQKRVSTLSHPISALTSNHSPQHQQMALTNRSPVQSMQTLVHHQRPQQAMGVRPDGGRGSGDNMNMRVRPGVEQTVHPLPLPLIVNNNITTVRQLLDTNKQYSNRAKHVTGSSGQLMTASGPQLLSPQPVLSPMSSNSSNSVGHQTPPTSLAPLGLAARVEPVGGVGLKRRSPMTSISPVLRREYFPIARPEVTEKRFESTLKTTIDEKSFRLKEWQKRMQSMVDLNNNYQRERVMTDSDRRLAMTAMTSLPINYCRNELKYKWSQPEVEVEERKRKSIEKNVADIERKVETEEDMSECVVISEINNRNVGQREPEMVSNDNSMDSSEKSLHIHETDYLINEKKIKEKKEIKDNKKDKNDLNFDYCNNNNNNNNSIGDNGANEHDTMNDTLNTLFAFNSNNENEKEFDERVNQLLKYLTKSSNNNNNSNLKSIDRQMALKSIGSRSEEELKQLSIESKHLSQLLESINESDFILNLDLIKTRDLKRKPRAYLNAKYPLRDISRSVYAGTATKKAVMDFPPKLNTKRVLEVGGVVGVATDKWEESKVQKGSKRLKLFNNNNNNNKRNGNEIEFEFESNQWSFVLKNLDFSSPLSQKIVGVLPQFQFKL